MQQESVQDPDSRFADLSGLKRLRATFEAQLESGRESSIEMWLNKVADEERSSLFRELLDVEFRFHQLHGRVPRAEEYMVRYPNFAREIEAVLKALELKPASGSNDQTIDSTVDDVPAVNSPVRDLRDWVNGEVVGRYQLQKFLGRGAFGEVWKAFDPELNRSVAIKLPRRDVAARFDLTSQFRDEARRAASLNDKGIVPVFDIGHVGSGTFIVSELIDGPTLAERIKAGPISREESVRIIILIARSLHQAHLAGLVHRDMKPSNLLLRSNGTPAITDFGLAISESEQLVAEGGIVGTASYMSPEQARGEGRMVDGRSDLYSLGVIFFQLLTGRLPFLFRTSDDLINQIRHREVRPLRSIDNSIPIELERICLRCLEKDIRQRYPTAKDLADDLERWSSSRKPPLPRRYAALATLATLLLVGVGFVVLSSRNGESWLLAVRKGNEPAGQRGKWLELLDQPLDNVATVKGDTTDFSQLNVDKQLLTMRTERNLWVLRSSQRGGPPLRIRGSAFVDEWMGSAGFVWGLSNDRDEFPKKEPQCFALLLERYDPNEPVKIVLKQLIFGEFIHDVPYIKHASTLAETPLLKPASRFQSIEVVVQQAGVEVHIDGEQVWSPEILDRKVLQQLVSAKGAVGVAGRGKTVTFREATVMFQD